MSQFQSQPVVKNDKADEENDKKDEERVRNLKEVEEWIKQTKQANKQLVCYQEHIDTERQDKNFSEGNNPIFHNHRDMHIIERAANQAVNKSSK